MAKRVKVMKGNEMKPVVTLLSFLVVFTVISRALTIESRGNTVTPKKSSPTGAAGRSQEVRFEWQPPDGPSAAYDLKSSEDQHRLVLFSGVEPGGTYPVVVGFHGQPKRGKPPREYKFLKNVPEIIGKIVQSGKLRPFVLVLPVFRFLGQNWPGFDMRKFRVEVEKQLKSLGINPGEWYAFGHSGAAGCGGEGLNRAHELSPKAVGFFDTCLGRGWQNEIKRLQKLKIETINIHSVETAGFRPRQRPEYQSTFDFGRAYGPLGLKPVTCPVKHPGKRLRDQRFRCSATGDGTIVAFVVDTGEGQPAHEALLPVAIRYFLIEHIGH